MNTKKLIIGIFTFIFLLLIYLNLPPTITDNANLYQIIGIAFVVLVLLGGLYVFR